MSKVSTHTICPNEECPGDIDIEGDVEFYRQGSPYGSTIAYEELVDVEPSGLARCEECGYELSDDTAVELLLDEAEREGSW
jgi:hypothetical protein